MNKASNLIEHREEIMSRPARSWFQTSKEKEALREAARDQQPTSHRAEGGGDEAKRKGKGKRGGGGAEEEGEGARPKKKRDKYEGMPRQKRRRLQREELLRGDGEGGGGVSLPNQKAIARGAKAAAKKGGLASAGINPSLKRALAQDGRTRR